MNWKVRTRWQASGLHLLLSVAIAVAAFAGMLAVWYPGELFEAAGGNELLLILVGVDIIIGPLITLVIFRRGKPGLKFDLSVIAVLQIAALIYGAHIVFLARPAFIVFVKDRFEVASMADLEPERLAEAKYPQFRDPGWGGPQWVAADPPTDPAEHRKMIDAALSGLDLHNFPRLWVPYAERRKEVLAQALPVERVRAVEPLHADVIDAYLARSGVKPADVRWLLLRARRAWVAVLVDARTAEPVKMLVAEKI